MRPVLVSLGPWEPWVIAIIFAVIYTLMLLWQWAEHRYAQGKPVTMRSALITLPPALLLAVGLWWLVNRLHPVEIKAWGTMLVVAFSAGTFYLARYADRKVIKPAEALDLALFLLIGAVIGARVIFVGLDWGDYAGHPAKLLNVWEGGLSFHGGLLGAFLAGLLFARKRGIAFWALADEAAPAIALGYSFARVGCFLNGCCHGNVCELPWAMRFPYSDLPHAYVHPTQLYSIVASMTIFFILIKLRGKFPQHGHLFGAYLAIYSVSRFLLEYTRAGATGKPMEGLPALTVGQFASILIFLVAVIAIVLTWNKPPREQRPTTKHASGKPR